MRQRVLAGVLAFVAVSAVGGGLYGLRGAAGVPVEWLSGTPFDSYAIPSAVLLVGVGGSSLVALVALIRRGARAVFWGSLAGGVLLGWIVVQVALIGYRSWMQPAYFALGALELALAQSARRGDRDDG